MEKLFCSYKLSVKLKDAGFNELCLAAYDRIEMLCTHSKNYFEPLNYNIGGNYTSAPLYQQVVDWLREKHKLDVVNHQDGDVFGEYVHRIYRCEYPHETVGSGDGGYGYYESLNKAIEEALTLIKPITIQ